MLHLKSACTALPDGTIVGWDPAVDDPDAFPVYEAVPEEPGAHVVRLAERHLLMATGAPRTARSFRDRGYTVTTVDVSEFDKLEGCVTCLSVPRAAVTIRRTGGWPDACRTAYSVSCTSTASSFAAATGPDTGRPSSRSPLCPGRTRRRDEGVTDR